MDIKVWNYLDEYENEKDEILNAIERVLKSGFLILGDHVKKFEEEFSRYCGVKFGIGVNSGTDALFLSLKALNIGHGDEVITVANTAVPTVSAIVSTGATPRFVDIDSETYLMDTSALANVINKNTKCILPVHLFGQCVNMDEVNEIASKYSLKIIEDCAQSHGGSYQGKKAGSMSDLSAFSFYPTKNLGGYGDGGMVLTNDEKIRDKLRRLRFYGMEKTYYSIEHGYNSRLDELHASILLEKLKHLDEYILKRKSIANTYNRSLMNTGLILPKILEGNDHSYYLYVCRHKKRDFIIEELKKRKIFVNISYPWPIHLMDGYKYLQYKEGDLPATEQAAKEIFSLPMYPSLKKEEQETVIGCLLEIVKTIE
jgi:dTDP-3-amino-2,3,6-trideoxy-4-keto-D-glucose/dTDP-3-amino-3,4,6-trideoxy-alpha-D-glucose/dTDP-2,6-dideoxy-D-kanosamine transaminase